jgi:hypothetical protein
MIGGITEFAGGGASDSKAPHQLLKEGILKKKSPKGIILLTHVLLTRFLFVY